nr:condensation domain-containing protein [uncultured bacterium]
MAAEADLFRLSPYQQYLDTLHAGSPGFVTTAVIDVGRRASRPQLADALTRLAARHDMLRATLARMPGLDRAVLAVRPVDATEGITLTDDSGRNLRLGVIEVRIDGVGSGWRIGFSASGLVADAQSLRILQSELADLLAGREPRPETPLPFVQYSEWQHALSERGGARRRSLGPATALPRPRLARNGPARSPVYGPAELTRVLSGTLPEGVGTSATLLACWAVLLWRLTGASPVWTAVGIDERFRAPLEGTFGQLTPYVPVAVPVDASNRLRDVAKLASEVLAQARVESPAWRPPARRCPFGFDESPPAALRHVNGEAVHLRAPTARIEPFELALTVEAGAEGTRLRLRGDPSCYDEAALATVADSLGTLVNDALEHPDRRVDRLRLVSPGALRHLRDELTGPSSAAPVPDLIQRFEMQVKRAPGRLAARAGAESVTYAQLNLRANRLARRLQECGVRADGVVGVLLPNSVGLLVSLLGVMKVGAAYLPLDTALPPGRVRVMLADAGVDVVVTVSDLAGIVDQSLTVLCLDRDLDRLNLLPGTDLGIHPPGESLAYVLYTSGSTGRPKGVMVTRAGLANYATWAGEAYGLHQGWGTIVHSPPTFDLTVTSLLAPLSVGQSVHLVPASDGVESVVRAVREVGDVTLLKLTPSHLTLLRHIIDDETAARIRCLVVGGEVLLPDDVVAWQAKSPGVRIMNEYGPTETVVGCSWWEVRPHDRMSTSVPIGLPIPNTTLRVLDDDLSALAPGCIGELFVGGMGVARGYLREPRLTAERFVPDPQPEKPGARLYRTGDLVFHAGPTGLHFTGRRDRQVKIRGHRVELEEVEVALTDHPGIANAAVELHRNRGGGDRLVAYVVAHEGATLTLAAMRDHLRSRLPEIMLPSALTLLSRWPVNAHGKLDRAALPPPAFDRGASSAPFVAPAGETERRVAAVWAEVLGLSEVGVLDNFFEIGGDSFSIVKMAARLKELSGAAVPVTRAFEFPTVRSLARSLDQPGPGAAVEIGAARAARRSFRATLAQGRGRR